jgi:CheY-like chemotaxis protein
MLTALPDLLAPLLVLVVVVFLTYRFGFFSRREIGGRYAFLSGGIILFLALVWEAIERTPDYNDWFVVGAYDIINLAQFLVGAAGLLLCIVGLALYADYWQVRREDIEERYGKLTILEHLHHDARQPYHLLEMLNISLREMLVHYPMAAGSILLVNRTRRQFVLTSSSGLHKDELAHLEYYPLGRNVVSQAVELGDPMLASGFSFVARTGQEIPSRFKSMLVLPLASGMEPIGALLLLAEERELFGRDDIRYLLPVAQWLSEKIRTARLSRELGQADTKRRQSVAQFDDLIARLGQSVQAVGASDAANAFCRTLVGLGESESVHLCAESQGKLVFIGSSEPLFDLSENLRTALLDGIGRDRPLVVNQESTDGEHGPSVVQSNLIFPLPSSSNSEALLLVRANRAFSIDDLTLRQIESFARLTGLVARLEEHQRSRLSRRKGFDVVLKLLQGDLSDSESSSNIGYFVETLYSALPRNSFCCAFEAKPGGTFGLAHGPGCPKDDRGDQFDILSDEGGVGRAATSRSGLFIHGRADIENHLATYHDQNRSLFQFLFGERGLPGFLAYSPILQGTEVIAVAMTSVYGMEEHEAAEWERFITLAAGLYSLRLAMTELQHRETPLKPVAPSSEVSGSIINRINNCLSGVVGIAELTGQRTDVPADVEAQLAEIVKRAEEAAQLTRETFRPAETDAPPSMADVDRLNQIITSELDQNHVSGDLYMVGLRPREIRTELGDVDAVEFSSGQVRELFRSVLERFSAVADEEDVITVATYLKGDHVYLDVSRHGRNFPAVQRVAEFGKYTLAPEAFRSRPGDIYLKHLAGSDSYYAADQSGPAPAFLSFKLPRATGSFEPALAVSTAIRLLAIDDQDVILDLISAMGRSLGYKVRTAASGEEGLRMAQDFTFDVVLTDMALPGISGLEVARRLRGLMPQLPIILVTGWSSDPIEADLRAAGIQEVLYKPFRIEQLTAVVQSVVASRAGI